MVRRTNNNINKNGYNNNKIGKIKCHGILGNDLSRYYKIVQP